MNTHNRSDTGITEEIEQSLYTKHQKIYPREVHGIFARLKASSVLFLLGIYYIFPWLQWEGRQAVLFDLPARKFYIFGLVFWPQDFFYLSLLLMLASFSLFFFTTLAGRLWCGYACPQTVWTEVFLWMERFVEGDRPRQIKLDKAPWNLRKLRIKATKQVLWLTFSLFTGFTFVGYFIPIRELSTDLIAFNLSGWEWFWFLFYGFATYGNAGFLREQICIYMCPYARFQSAMFDKDTLIIAYDTLRGEPRGSRKKGEDYKARGLGDCIHCTLCVQACPTGIDIRDGLQEQCIGCAACVDVCNEVMGKMGYPKGLVRYTTENRLEGVPTHILRPRVYIYALILLAIFAGTVYSIAMRIPLELDIIRDRQSLYKITHNGKILNVYRLKILNMDQHPHTYKLTAGGIDGLILDNQDTLQVPAGTVQDFAVRLIAEPAHLSQRSTVVQFELIATDAPEIRVIEDSRFLRPL
jgi:cytochrome c oxidase accessory protein FixG